MSDLSPLIAACAAAKAVWEEADRKLVGQSCIGPEWDAYQAAEAAVVLHPCRTLEEVREKAAFFLADDSAYDTLRNCYTGEWEALSVFLQSLSGEVPVEMGGAGNG